MKIKPFFIILINILFFFSCKNSNTDFNSTNNIDINYSKTKEEANKSKNIKLFFPYSKLKLFFGKDFIPVFNEIVNVDSDVNEEYIIAFKKEEEANINVALFDIGKGDALKTKVIYESNIFFDTNFSIHVGNLFYEDDICLIIEGKSKENKNLLVILNYDNDNDNYKIVKEFVADYSTVLNYKEIETDKAKYSILKDVVTISKSYNTTNTGVQQKEIYEWDYNQSIFKLVKSEDFIVANNTISSDILYSEEKYYNYISGFWYPQQYALLMENKTITEDLLKEENIQFLFFSENAKEVSIKYGDYIDKYNIFKISKVWIGQKPGLRLFLNESSKPNMNYIKFMDVYLNTPTFLKVNGPEKFTLEDFVRLSKPFIEYVNEKKAEINKNKSLEIMNFLNGEFTNNDYLLIIKDSSYELKKDIYFSKGYYKLSFIKNYTIISFIEDNSLKENTRLKNNLLEKQNYIINIFKNENYFTLTPIKLQINDFNILDYNSIVFKKK